MAVNEDIQRVALQRIGEYFKERRLDLQLSRAELADRAGVTTRAIEKIERGEFFWSSKLLFTLCEALELYLFFEPKSGEGKLATLMRDMFPWNDIARERNKGDSSGGNSGESGITEV